MWVKEPQLLEQPGNVVGVGKLIVEHMRQVPVPRPI